MRVMERMCPGHHPEGLTSAETIETTSGEPALSKWLGKAGRDDVAEPKDWQGSPRRRCRIRCRGGVVPHLSTAFRSEKRYKFLKPSLVHREVKNTSPVLEKWEAFTGKENNTSLPKGFAGRAVYSN